MLTPATIDGNMQGIPTTAPDSIRVFHTTGSASKFWLSLFWQKAKTCNCDTVWRRLSLTGAESGPFGFKVLKDPGKAWGYSVHHWWCPCLIAMVDHCICNGYGFCLVFMDGDCSDFSFWWLILVFGDWDDTSSPGSPPPPSWRSQCSRSSDLPSASHFLLSLPASGNHVPTSPP